MNSSNERDVRQEALELNNKITKISEMVGERKLSDKQRSAFIQLLVRASSFSVKASETGSISSLGLAKKISRMCEISLLAHEKGKGEKIDILKQKDIKIIGSENIKILNQLMNEDNLPFWEKYRRDLIIAVSSAVVTAIITSFF